MSAASQPPAYVPRDQLFLWWVAQPSEPVLVGQLSLVRSPRGVSLRYDMPDYQKGVVPDTVARGKRAVPDISAISSCR